jgi:putative transposase
LATYTAKWLYNWLVSDIQRLSLSTCKVHTVEVKVKENFEPRTLTILGSQVKQEIADRLKDNLRSLSTLKKNGHKVGALKHKSYVNSIPFKQHGITYRLDSARNRVRIQKLGKFRVIGLHQIPDNAEIANAMLIRKPSGYYLHITCYLPKDSCASKNLFNMDIGIDFGISSKLTLSNGIKIDFEIYETARLKQLQRKLARTQYGSKNRDKVRYLLRKEYGKLNNRRKDAQNKVLAYLRCYKTAAFQDDSVKGWTSLFGRQVHSSGIGGLKTRLSTSLETPIPMAKSEPTTSECFKCGKRHKLALSDRIISCDCGWRCDRDINAALVILRKGLGLSPKEAVGLDRPELKPLERETAARILGSNPYICVSFP